MVVLLHHLVEHYANVDAYPCTSITKMFMLHNVSTFWKNKKLQLQQLTQLTQFGLLGGGDVLFTCLFLRDD